jgi:helix-turn-helix protein
MSNDKKDNFLFDTDDSDQQILPFDFLDGEDEEKIIESEIKEKEPLQSEKKDEKEDISLVENETPEAKEEITEILNDKNAEKMTKYGPIASNEKLKDEKELNEKFEDKIEKEEDSTEKDQLPETIKMPAPEKENKSNFKPKQKTKKNSNKIPSYSEITPGQILQEARVRKDLSLDQVVQSTKINRISIEALEQGEKNNLPAPVYVDAYIKTLCALYEIDSHQVLQGIIKQKPGKVVPGELLHHIEEGKQINIEEEAKVNKIIKIAAIVILILALAIIIKVKMASPEATEESEKQPEIAKNEPTEKIEPKITSKNLEIFLYHQPFTMTEMTIPEKKTDGTDNNIL